MREAILLLLLMPLISGCSTARDAAVPMVRLEARKDLSCTKAIFVEPLGSGRYQAVGCGRTTTYQTSCDLLRCAIGAIGEQPSPSLGRPDPGDPRDLR